MLCVICKYVFFLKRWWSIVLVLGKSLNVTSNLTQAANNPSFDTLGSNLLLQRGCRPPFSCTPALWFRPRHALIFDCGNQLGEAGLLKCKINRRVLLFVRACASKRLGVINPKHHERNTTIRSDKQHNYTLVLGGKKKWMRLKNPIRNKRPKKVQGKKRTKSVINVFNISFSSPHTS